MWKKKLTAWWKTRGDHLHLLNRPILELPKYQLPTNGGILRRYCHIIYSKQLRYKSTKSNIICSMQKGKYQLKCQLSGAKCETGIKGCLVKEVINIWCRAGFQKDFLMKSWTIRDKIEKLNKKWRKQIDLKK